MVRLLGIDPGLRFTGWGVIEADGNRLRHIADGVIATDSTDSVPPRLKVLHAALALLLADQLPDEAAVEETYVNRNGTATLKLGYARGVALLAPALAGIPVAEYGAKSVKLVGGRHRRRRQGAGADDGPPPAAGRHAAPRRCRRRARRRDLPRAPPRQPAGLGRGVRLRMIAKLTGRVEAIERRRAASSTSTASAIWSTPRPHARPPCPRRPAAAQLLIETRVREDAHRCSTASPTAAERDWFRLLTTVQGVGAKVALAILSALSPRDLVARDRRRRPRQPDAAPPASAPSSPSGC